MIAWGIQPPFGNPFPGIGIPAFGGGNLLPKAGLLLRIKSVDSVLTDIVGLSVSDYLLVPAAHRPIYFINETTMRAIGDIITNIEASVYLNDGGELVGDSLLGYAQYADGTELSVLLRAYRFYGQVYPAASFPYTFPFNLG